MKRHEALHPLSRDHHNILVHARRLRGLDARFDAATARRRFLSYWPVLQLHFDEEEAILGRRLADPELRRRMVAEHAELRRRAGSLATASPEEQSAFGEALRLHVRFEEDVLFPHLEAASDQKALDSIATETVASRQRSRPDSLQGGEACFL
jgi:SpoVK/Ycf46/Vps4 family AAA+-type ATPase